MGVSESIKNGKFVTTIFFQIMLNEVLKNCKKMISVVIKTDVKQQELKDQVAAS